MNWKRKRINFGTFEETVIILNLDFLLSMNDSGLLVTDLCESSWKTDHSDTSAPVCIFATRSLLVS